MIVVFFIFLDQVQGLWAAACLLQMHSRHLQESEPLPSLSLIWRAMRCLFYLILNLFSQKPKYRKKNKKTSKEEKHKNGPFQGLPHIFRKNVSITSK